jgi:nitroreductase
VTQAGTIIVQSDRTLRAPSALVAPQFIDRWSSRAFSDAKVSESELASLFEAARWAPSASNTQPWLFIYADAEPDLGRFRALLRDSNRRWADRAPVLAFVFAAKLKPDGQPNTSALLDAGAAWMSLALQGHTLGLNTRAMGGIHRDRIHAELGVPEAEYHVACAIAIGRPGHEEELPLDLRERNKPNDRKAVEAFVSKGHYRAQ